jgi:hypothetical protein
MKEKSQQGESNLDFFGPNGYFEFRSRVSYLENFSGAGW